MSPDPAPSDPGGDTPVLAAELVSLSIPADARYLRIARLVVAGIAAELDLGLDRVDDLRVAIDEIGALLLDAGGDPQLEIRIESTSDVLAIGARRTSTTGRPEIHPVTRSLLDATVDGLAITTDGDPSAPALEIRAHLALDPPEG